jgi:disulfide bond formation protein DsbB
MTQCTSTSGLTVADILSAPLVRCDQVQWELLGISMAGWNAILSTGFGLVILWLSLRKPRIRR